VAFKDKSIRVYAPLSPHPNPLPMGEGVSVDVDEKILFNAFRSF
jgi:hypothetical protein